MVSSAVWRRRRETSRRPAAAALHSGATIALAEGWVSMAPLVLCSALVAFALFYNTLDAEFAYDDSRAIKTNPDVLPTTPVSALLQNDFWGTPLSHSGSHKSYRPITVLSFRLNYLVGGLDPFGYHLVNVLLHCVVCALFARLAALLLGSRSPAAWMSALLFAVHPVHTEAVAGVVGRADVGAALFFLLSFLSYSAYLRQRAAASAGRPQRQPVRNGTSGGHHGAAPPAAAGAGGRAAALLLCFVYTTAAMFTKEHGVTVLGVCVVYDLLVHSRLITSWHESHFTLERCRRLLEGPAALLAMAALLLTGRLLVMGARTPQFSPADNPAADSDSPLTRALTFLHLPAVSAALLLCPSTLSFDWSMDAIPLVTSVTDRRNGGSAALYAAAALLVVALLRQLQTERRLGVRWPAYDAAPADADADGDSAAGLTRLGAVSVIGVSASGGGGGVAAADCAAGGVRARAARAGGRTEAALLAVSLLVIPFLPATNLFFYVGFVVAERILYIPSMGFCLLVGVGFGAARSRLGRRARTALSVAAVALLLTMACRTYRRNLDWQTEERLYRAGIVVNPPKAFGNLANILSAAGLKEEAERAYKMALSFRSNMADVHYNLGILYQEEKRYEEALQSYDKAILYRPRMAMAHLNKGLVLGLSGEREAAAAVYRHCSTLDGSGLKDPRSHEATKISALFNLGRLHADQGLLSEAVAIYKEAIERMPAHYQPQSLYNMVGEAYFKMDQLAEAEHWYQQALKVKPDHVPAHLTYAKLLAKMGRPAEAEVWFIKAMELSPNDPIVYQHYGQHLADGERLSEAADIYRRAAELAPADYEMVFNAANVLRQAALNDEAERYYRVAVQLRPNEATSHMNLGAMLHVNGKLAEAEQSYLAALRIRPDDQITKANLQKLRHLHPKTKRKKSR